MSGPDVIRLFRSILFLLLAFTAASRGVSQQPPFTRDATQKAASPPADLATVLQPILEKHRELPGLIGAIVDRDGATAIGAVGVRKAGASEPMTTGDLIHLGSDTKAMTATLIGKLFESKRLSATDTMADVFPNLRPVMNAEMAKATVAQLLDHTAGLPRNVGWWAIDRTKRPLIEQRRMVVEEVLSKAPENPPGTKYEYSNVGFVVLGAILEAKTGQRWEDSITTELFKPLGMTTAGFGPPGTPGKIDQPWGHIVKNGRFEPSQFDNPPVMGPAGRVHCSIADWGKFVSLYFDPERQSPRILAPATIRELTTPGPIGSYAGGWIITKRSWGGGTVLTHAGSNTMWYCVVWATPNRHFAVLVATNVGGHDASKACDEAAGALIKFHAEHKTAK